MKFEQWISFLCVEPGSDPHEKEESVVKLFWFGESWKKVEKKGT
jgi:hypothetical protein